MDRQDGKDPFDYHTYYAENGLTIATMIEFRAFCAGFFERHVRPSTPTNEALMAKFIKLITRAEMLFARARAVIPEVQVPQDQSSHENANIRRVLLATQALRGSNTKRWSNQPDELAWLKLANDGQALVDKGEKEGKGHVKQASNAGGEASPNVTTGNGHKKQASNGSVPASSSVTTGQGPEKQVSGASTRASAHATLKDKAEATKPKMKSKLEDLPTFVPASAFGNQETVWSPTRGTRLRRLDEMYQVPVVPAASPTPMSFGQALTPTHRTPLSQTPMQGTIDSLTGRLRTLHTRTSLTDSPQTSPTPQAGNNLSPVEITNLYYARPQNRVNTRSSPTPFHEHIKQVYEPRKQANRPPPISPISNMGGPRYPVNRTADVPDVEPFSAPPNVQQFQGRHDSGQGAYGGSVMPFQPPPSGHFYNPIVNTNNFAPNPQLWGIQPPAPAYISPEYLPLPPPDSMTPVEYWDMLYQREHDIRNRLANTHLPPTEEVLHHFARLEQARMTAVATNLPARGNLHKKKWLSVLQKEMNGIWKAQTRTMPLSPIVVARKQDYEKVIEEEIRAANRET